MSKVIMFSMVFPSYHPRKGEPTYFVEKILKSINDFSCVTEELMDSCGFLLSKENFIEYRIKIGFEKHHTIRSGNRWKVGDKFSPRVWSGKPYRSKQIVIAPDIEIKKVWPITVRHSFLNGNFIFEIKGYRQFSALDRICVNDGLTLEDFENWFKKDVPIGQIICWNPKIEY